MPLVIKAKLVLPGVRHRVFPFFLPISYFPCESVMQKSVRVLVANRPKLMRELILATFANQPDIEVVGEVADDREIPKRVSETLPDFLFIALDEPGKRPGICDTIFRHHPRVRIIAIAPGEDCSVCYWTSTDIHSNNLEVSEGAILGAIRKARHLAGKLS
jgi:hypothetical protein